MNNLNLANPKMMDVAVPANQRIGLQQTADGDETWSVVAGEALSEAGTQNVLLVDLRDTQLHS